MHRCDIDLIFKVTMDQNRSDLSVCVGGASDFSESILPHFLFEFSRVYTIDI